MNLAEIDRSLTARITHPHSIWKFFSRLGDGWLYAASFLWLREMDRYAEANKLAASVLIAWGICAALKAVFPRKRPRACLMCRTMGDHPSRWHRYKRASILRSFPSQHAAVAVAFAFALWPAPAPVGLAVLICAARVMGGAHYLGDVIAGVVVGLLAGGLA